MRVLSAIEESGGEATYDKIDSYEQSDLPESYKVALRLVDAMTSQPGEIDDALVAQVRRHFSPEQAVEIVCDVTRNSSQKVAVSLDQDQANVTEGVEYYEISPEGETIHLNQFSTVPA